MTAAPVATNHVVQLDELTKVYTMGQQQVHALAGVSVNFDRGSFWAVMGPSGSGKSTMLNLLGCLDRPTAGRYLLEGQDVGQLDDDALSEFRLNHLGFIFQSFNLITQLTVRENIELPLYYLGWDADASADRARELAAMVGLEDRLDHRPAELSGGQQQRVAVARALVTDPSIIMADEPTGNLDSMTGEAILNLITDLHDRGMTIIMVTHDERVAERCQRIVFLRDGEIESDVLQ
jgi:putative ABC transport system ATP-binding protein